LAETDGVQGIVSLLRGIQNRQYVQFVYFELMSRLSIEIEPDQHGQIKTLATFEGMTIKEFILSRTSSPKKQVKEADTTEKLLTDLESKKRLLEAIQTPRKEYLVFETMDDLKDAFGI